MSTYQAVVEALGLLEHNPSLRTALLAPLALLTAHQAAFDPAVAARMAGRKEGEEGSWVRGQSGSKAGGKAGVCAGLGGNRFDGQGGQGGDGVGRGSKSRREEVEACDGKEGAKTMKR